MTAKALRSPHTAVYGMVCPYCPTLHPLLSARRPGEHEGVRRGFWTRLAAHAASRRVLRATERANHNAVAAPRFAPTRGLARARARAWLDARADYRELSPSREMVWARS
jgi:hypothetical protein